MKIAIVHDWLTTYAGAERVLEQMLCLYPSADLFSIVDFLSESNRTWLKNKRAKTTFIQCLPFSKKKYRNYFPLMPLAIEQLDVSGYDLIISSSHAVAKGVLVGPTQLHIGYIYTPIRYAWDLQHQYLNESGLNRGVKSWVARYFLHRMRDWDFRTANNVDYFVAISNYIAKRIWRVYRREADVVYPPVDVHSFGLVDKKDDYYVTASRLVPYKRVDLIVRAFNGMPDKKLVVIGDGPDYKKIKSVAGSNVQVLGYQSPEVLKRYLQGARAYIYAALEDFGIAPLEAQACGTPVVAYGGGAVGETIVDLGFDNPTGVLFYEQEISFLQNAVNKLEANQYLITSMSCRKNAERFSTDVFLKNFSNYVQNCCERFFNKK